MEFTVQVGEPDVTHQTSWLESTSECSGRPQAFGQGDRGPYRRVTHPGLNTWHVFHAGRIEELVSELVGGGRAAGSGQAGRLSGSRQSPLHSPLCCRHHSHSCTASAGVQAATRLRLAASHATSADSSVIMYMLSIFVNQDEIMR